MNLGAPKGVVGGMPQEYQASSLAFDFLIPPYQTLSMNGYNYLRMNVPKTQSQNIMYYPAKQVLIVPLVDTKRQMVIVPQDKVD